MPASGCDYYTVTGSDARHCWHKVIAGRHPLTQANMHGTEMCCICGETRIVMPKLWDGDQA